MKTVFFIEEKRKLSLAVGVRLKAMGYDVVTAINANRLSDAIEMGSYSGLPYESETGLAELAG